MGTTDLVASSDERTATIDDTPTTIVTGTQTTIETETIVERAKVMIGEQDRIRMVVETNENLPTVGIEMETNEIAAGIVEIPELLTEMIVTATTRIHRRRTDRRTREET